MDESIDVMKAANERWHLQREREIAAQAMAGDIEGMRTEILRLCENDIKRVYIARQAGVPPSTLSQFLNRKYAGDEASVYLKLAKWHAEYSSCRRENIPVPVQWVETPTGKRIEQALTFAHVEPTIAVIYGNPGLGKTASIAKYQQANGNVWVATSAPASGGTQATIAQVAAALGLRYLPVTPYQQSRDIIARLRESKGLLIIDEAQHLSREAIDQLRAFHDASSIGLCLSGNMHVYSRVYGKENSEYLAQFSSRVGLKLVLREPTSGDVDAVLDPWNITGGAEVEFARQIAAQPGALRSLFQCLRQAHMVAHARGRPIDVKLMREARASLGYGGGQ